MNKVITLLDLRGLLMHSLHAGKDKDALPYTDHKGREQEQNRAIFGIDNFITRYLTPILEHHAPINVIGVLDGGKAYRRNLYPKYKLKRETNSANMTDVQRQELEQIQELGKRLLMYMGSTIMKVDTVEADDVIGLLTEKFHDYTVIIYTVDADLLQLRSERVHVYLKDQIHMDDHYHGIPTNLIRLNKSLVGDQSDEYSGVNRIGEKAWDALVEEYGHDGLEQMEQCVMAKDYTLIEECLKAEGPKPSKGGLALARIYERREEWELMFNLADLHPEICWGRSGRKLIRPQYIKRVPDAKRLLDVLTRCGCSEFWNVFEGYMPTETLVTSANLDATFDHMDNHLKHTPILPFDYETYDAVKNPDWDMAVPKSRKGKFVDTLSQEITGCSFNYGSNLQYTAYFSTYHRDTANVAQSTITDIFGEIHNSLKIPMVAHNFAFEQMVSEKELDFVFDHVQDTIIMSSYVDENVDAGLKDLSRHYLGYEQVEYKEVMEQALPGLIAANVLPASATYNDVDMSLITGDQVLGYGCDDSLVTGHLHVLFNIVMRVEGTLDFYMKEQKYVSHVLTDAFETGTRIDMKELRKQEASDKILRDESMAKIRASLAEHCSQPNPDGANAFYEADLPYHKASQKHDKGHSGDKLTAELEKIRLLGVEKSVYEPYREEEVPYEFIPTKTQINELLTRAKFAEGVVDEESKTARYRLKTASVSNVTELLVNIREDATLLNVTERQQELLDCIATAASQLNKRAGEDYDALVAFVAEHFPKASKINKFGDELNFNSPNQVQQLLYCKMGLPVRIRTLPKKGSGRDKLGTEGSPATNDEAFTKAIAEDCPMGSWQRELLQDMVQVKTCDTRASLYWNPYPYWAHPRNADEVEGTDTIVLHPGIRDCGTVTRRPTGTSPNILQVKKGETRKIYIPRYNDHIIMPLDFSGQELRLTGSEANDPVLIDAYTGGGVYTDEDGMTHDVVKDIHSVTACGFAKLIIERENPELLKYVPLDENGIMDYEFFRQAATSDTMLLAEWDNFDVHPIISAIRKSAKIVNFLIIYGGTAFTLSMKLGMPEGFTEQLMQGVFKRYPRLKAWQEETAAFGKANGYVKTAYGNWKHLTDDIISKDHSAVSRQERQAVNQTIQGCAADILKIVLTKTHETNLWKETSAKLIAPVYDEIVVSVPKKNAYEFACRAQDIMNVTPPGHRIPMMAEVSLGPNWGEVTELGDWPSEKKVVAAIDKLC